MSVIKGTNQIVAGFGGTKRSIGEVYFSQSSLATDNSGALPLFTGETITSANTIYPEFYNWILAHTELQCTSAEYESALSTYGECPKYVVSSGSLRLPKLSNYIKAANTSEGITQKEAGLPNITGFSDWWSFGEGTNNPTGAFFHDDITSNASPNAGTNPAQLLKFDASKSNSIYGKSDTVTPPSTTLYPWVVAYAAAIPASTAQAAEFQQGLSGKADTNLGNTTPSQIFKEMSVGWGMVDYSAGVVSALPYTSSSKCCVYLNIKKSASQDSTSIVYINGVEISDILTSSNGQWEETVNIVLYMDKGDVLTTNSTNALYKLVVFPLKGVN